MSTDVEPQSNGGTYELTQINRKAGARHQSFWSLSQDERAVILEPTADALKPMKAQFLLCIVLLPLCGCVQPTRSTGFMHAGVRQKTLPPCVPHRVAVFISGHPAIAGQAEELFATGLLGMGFDLVERNKLSALTNEMNLSKLGYITPETAVQSGRLIGADGVFVGNASGESSLTWTDTHLSIRFVETASGKTIWSVNANDPRAVAFSMAIETSIIYTTKAALKALEKDISKMKPVVQ